MKPAEELKLLRSKEKELQKKIANCKHDFEEAIYDPEKVMEGYGYKLVGHGSDVYTEYEGYSEVSKDRWSRTCKICGHTEYTNKIIPVVVKTEPKFD